jgi:hypothetical protein
MRKRIKAALSAVIRRFSSSTDEKTAVPTKQIKVKAEAKKKLKKKKPKKVLQSDRHLCHHCHNYYGSNEISCPHCRQYDRQKEAHEAPQTPLHYSFHR